jgi:hypothetical protein
VKEHKSFVRLKACLASTTNSIDNMDIVVSASGKHAGDIARAVLGTILFPEPRP